jgi:sugar lactone lactonase YvrE
MSSQESAVVEAQTLLSDLVIGESPRWHDGRLWFAHWGTGEIVAVDLEGRREVVDEGPPGLGWSIERALADLGLTSEIGSSNA